MTIPTWSQPDAERKLPVGLYDILKIVVGYVDEGWKIKIDAGSIEQEVTNIEDSIEDLAMRIEAGEFRDDR